MVHRGALGSIRRRRSRLADHHGDVCRRIARADAGREVARLAVGRGEEPVLAVPAAARVGRAAGVDLAREEDLGVGAFERLAVVSEDLDRRAVGGVLVDDPRGRALHLFRLELHAPRLESHHEPIAVEILRVALLDGRPRIARNERVILVRSGGRGSDHDDHERPPAHRHPPPSARLATSAARIRRRRARVKLVSRIHTVRGGQTAAGAL